MSVNWYADGLSNKAREAALAGLEEGAYLIKSASMEKTPVDTGTLRNSHTIERDDSAIYIGVGGPAAPYALKIHQDASLTHVVGEDHFLQKAFDQGAEHARDLMKARVDAALR